MFTHMHYRVLGVVSLRIQGPVEREYLNNSDQAVQSDDAIEGSAPRGRPYPVIEAIVRIRGFIRRHLSHRGTWIISQSNVYSYALTRYLV